MKIAIVGMPEGYEGASPNAHLLIGEMPAPAQLKSQWRVLTGGSALPLIVLAVCAYIALRVAPVRQAVSQELIDNFNITWLQAPMAALPPPNACRTASASAARGSL